MRKASELDYKSRIKGYGGSPKGRDVRKCPRNLKYRAWQLAVEIIAGGNESFFISNPNAKSRFSAKAFEPIVVILWQEMPNEMHQYLDGRIEKGPKLISERVHKMYYTYDIIKKIRSRGKSKEHPSNWLTPI